MRDCVFVFECVFVWMSMWLRLCVVVLADCLCVRLIVCVFVWLFVCVVCVLSACSSFDVYVCVCVCVLV